MAYELNDTRFDSIRKLSFNDLWAAAEKDPEIAVLRDEYQAALDAHNHAQIKSFALAMSKGA